jgi:chromosome segregation ATPase
MTAQPHKNEYQTCENGYSRVLEKLGYLSGKVEDLGEKVEGLKALINELKEDLETVETRVNKQDVFIGKIGLGIAALAFVASTAFNFIAEWIKRIIGI